MTPGYKAPDLLIASPTTTARSRMPPPLGTKSHLAPPVFIRAPPTPARADPPTAQRSPANPPSPAKTNHPTDQTACPRFTCCSQLWSRTSNDTPPDHDAHQHNPAVRSVVLVLLAGWSGRRRAVRRVVWSCVLLKLVFVAAPGRARCAEMAGSFRGREKETWAVTRYSTVPIPWTAP